MPTDPIRDESAFVPIPPIFHSLEKGGPFTKCLLCDRILFGGDGKRSNANQSAISFPGDVESGTDQIEPRTYYIERIFRGNEPIIEYALCICCDGELRSEISKDSLEKIEMFFAEHVDLDQRVANINAGENPNAIESWLDACVVTKEKFADCHEKQILAICHGDRLALPTAMMLSGTAISMLIPMLSKKTRDWLGEFTSTNFGMPPEFCDEPDVFPVFL